MEKDQAIKQVMKRRAERSPKLSLPADFSAQVLSQIKTPEAQSQQAVSVQRTTSDQQSASVQPLKPKAESTSNKSKRMWSYWLAAACVVLVAVMGIQFFLNNTEEPQRTAVQTHPTPTADSIHRETEAVANVIARTDSSMEDLNKQTGKFAEPSNATPHSVTAAADPHFAWAGGLLNDYDEKDEGTVRKINIRNHRQQMKELATRNKQERAFDIDEEIDKIKSRGIAIQDLVKDLIKEDSTVLWVNNERQPRRGHRTSN